MARIAIVSTMGGNAWGGSEFLWASLADEALRDGHEVFISVSELTFAHPVVVDLRNRGAQVFPQEAQVSRARRWSRRLRHPERLRSYIRRADWSFEALLRARPDALCVSQGDVFDVLLYPDLRCLTQGSPRVVILSQLNRDARPALPLELRAIANDVFSHATHNLFVSWANLRLAERQLAKAIPRSAIVQNPVNIADKSLVQWPLVERIQFANVARLDVSFKGQDVLFEVLSSSEWRARDWTCHLYGTGPDEAYLRDLAEFYGISERVLFCGHVDDIRSVWGSSQILLLPSRREGTPLTLIEAMLCGRPAVVTNVGDNARWITSAAAGFVAEAATGESFGDAMERAWFGRSRWQEMGARAHDYASSHVEPFPGRRLLSLVIGNRSRMQGDRVRHSENRALGHR